VGIEEEEVARSGGSKGRRRRPELGARPRRGGKQRGGPMAAVAGRWRRAPAAGWRRREK
jgi:hypothetical protein